MGQRKHDLPDGHSSMGFAVDMRPLSFTESEPGVYRARYRYRSADSSVSAVFGLTVRLAQPTDDARSRAQVMLEHIRAGFAIVGYREPSSEEMGLLDERSAEEPEYSGETIFFEPELVEFDGGLERRTDLVVDFIGVVDPHIDGGVRHRWSTKGGRQRNARIRVTDGTLNVGRRVTQNSDQVDSARQFSNWYNVSVLNVWSGPGNYTFSNDCFGYVTI